MRVDVAIVQGDGSVGSEKQKSGARASSKRGSALLETDAKTFTLVGLWGVASKV